ncbi:MAG: hypothetical protein AAF721_12010 [Myxococcota bacterium]
MAEPTVVPVAAVTAEPTAAVRTPEPKAVPPEDGPPCDEGDGSLRHFGCLSQRLCSDVGRSSETDPDADSDVDAVDFLCAAQAAQAPEGGPLRMDDILSRLPPQFLHNFTLKHGTKEKGLRGHPQEIMADIVHQKLAKRSQSADLDFPRLMMWDESTGFTISYNGGLAGDGQGGRSQTGFDRLDLMRWDETAQTFELWALDLPIQPDEAQGWRIEPYRPDDADDNCTDCHGPDSRPVWPMYPDWPGFYGSDNDELTAASTHQKTERTFLHYFRHCVVPGTVRRDATCRATQDAALAGMQPPPSDEAQRIEALATSHVDSRRRYGTLFTDRSARYLDSVFAEIDVGLVRDYLTGIDARLGPRATKRVRSAEALVAAQGTAAQLQAWMGLTLHEAYPYRPNARHEITEASRAFFHRPNLRLGVMYNRMIARQVHAKLRRHDNYRGYEKLFAYALMDCAPPSSPRTPGMLAAFEAQTKTDLDAAGMRLTARGHPGRVLYPSLLAAVGLSVRDVDMRYSYPNKRFAPFDRGVVRAKIVDNPMALGYLKYGPKDHNRDNDAPYYFNAYWDGSATFNELLAAHVLADVVAADPSYDGLYTLQTLGAKYERFKTRLPLDAAFFADMDALGGWLPTPYPKRLDDIHHRQPFGKAEFREQYRAVCTRLATDVASAR